MSNVGNYMVLGALIWFPTVPKNEWEEICKQWGHTPQTYAFLEKYQKKKHMTFCEFCKSMGHDI